MESTSTLPRPQEPAIALVLRQIDTVHKSLRLHLSWARLIQSTRACDCTCPEPDWYSPQEPAIALILSQIDTVHTLTSYFFKIHLKIIFPSMPRSPKWTLSFMFFDYHSVCISHLLYVYYMSRSSRPQCVRLIGWDKFRTHITQQVKF
jgi:hypothetical protein